MTAMPISAIRSVLAGCATAMYTNQTPKANAAPRLTHSMLPYFLRHKSQMSHTRPQKPTIQMVQPMAKLGSFRSQITAVAPAAKAAPCPNHRHMWRNVVSGGHRHKRNEGETGQFRGVS